MERTLADDVNVPPPDTLFMAELLKDPTLTDVDRERLTKLSRDGYLIFDLEEGSEFDAQAEEIIATLKDRYEGDSARIEEAWRICPPIRSLAAHPTVMETLKTVYRRDPIPFQTLNFRVGSQQSAHSDTVHFHCAPHRYMCGVWVALEDTDADNGPLMIWPGSHHLPIFDMFDLGLRPEQDDYPEYERRVLKLLKGAGIEPIELHVRKGQAVIWVANLFHGGKLLNDASRSRHSQVTHYYFEDCVYYLPKHSVPCVGRVTLREVINIAEGKFVTHRYRDQAIDLESFPHVWRYPRPIPSWVELPDDPPQLEGDTGIVSDYRQRIKELIDSPDLREKLGIDEYVGGLERRINDQSAKIKDLEHTMKGMREKVVEVTKIVDLQDELIQLRNEEFPYKVCRWFTKKWRDITGAPDPWESRKPKTEEDPTVA